MDATAVPMDGQFIRKSEYKVKGSNEATVISGATRSCVSHHIVCSKMWEGHCVYGWKMRHRKGCRQWGCCEGEGHVVIQLHKV